MGKLLNESKPIDRRDFMKLFVKKSQVSLFTIFVLIFIFASIAVARGDVDYPIVDTGQYDFYGNSGEIDKPVMGEDFYGQDATYIKNKRSYKNNGDGTIVDEITGLMWQADAGEKKTYDEAVKEAKSLRLGGYDDWRMPTIKELYSLINFSGKTGSSSKTNVAYLDGGYFKIYYGDESAGERFIDVQYMSSTKYVGKTMKGDDTVFGVNFVDGRIKGYGLYDKRTKKDKKFYTIFVRGNENYGKNEFVNNGDGTISDLATGLMWMKEDSKSAMKWKDALGYAESFESSGYSDWRLPDAKELQSIVDYSKSPSTSGNAAIDSLFDCTRIVDEGGGRNYPFYWTSTTHLDGKKLGQSAVYVAFGEALGFMKLPRSNSEELLDVHGAGAQRSDPKTGDASDYPNGFGPQGDVRRINNFVRLVRDIGGEHEPKLEELDGDFGAVLIGTGGPVYSEKRSSPSVLIFDDDDYYLVDMGYGTQKRLMEFGVSLGDIETIMFTHHHMDHNEEYPGVLTKGWLKGRDHLNLIGPVGTRKLHEFVTEFYEKDMEYRASKKRRWSWNGIKTNVDIQEFDGSGEHKFDGLMLRTDSVNHSIETQAYRFENDEKSIVISGDLTYSKSLVNLAKDADVLIMDSGSIIKIGSKGDGNPPSDDRAHSSLDEVAKMAKESNVKKLVLTHIGGDIDAKRQIEAINAIYNGKVIIGEDLMIIK
jgi:ribonuclease BN (tRNA processing enzyme)